MKSAGMTQRQREANRKRYAAWLVRIDREIEVFKKTAIAKAVRSNVFVVMEYTASDGLVIRTETPKPEYRARDVWGKDLPDQFPRPRYFWARAGLPRVELCAFSPSEAREEIELLLAGDETTIKGAYLATNFGGRDCYFNSESEQNLFQGEPLVVIKTILEKWQADLKLCGRSPRREERELLWNLRRRIYHRQAALKRLDAFTKRVGLKIKAKPIAESSSRAA